MLRCVLVAAVAANTSLALRRSNDRSQRANLGEAKQDRSVGASAALRLAARQPASSASWGLDRIGAGPRRSQVQGRGVHIFVVDGGVRTTHQDFGGRATPAVDFTSGKSQDQTPKECHGDTSCAVDLNGLGTFAAGLAAGTVHGVASQALVHAVKVINREGNTVRTSRLVAALNWIAAAGVRPAVAAITLNAGGYSSFMLASVLQEAADAAIAAGVTIVNTAGENRRAEDACKAGPSYVPSVITVGATFLNTGYDVKWPRGNGGQCVDLWAPGPGVRSITNADDTASATSQEAFEAAAYGSDGFERGGSAAAHVAGAAALVLEEHPDFQSPQVKQRLLSDASVDYIHGLGSDDHNRMLYVGEDAPLPRGTENLVGAAFSPVASPAEASSIEPASEKLPATGLPCGGTGLSPGMYKVDGGLMNMKGQMVDETFQLYFNVTSIQDKDDGSLICSSMRWSFDDTRSIIAGAPVRNWVGWRYHRSRDEAASPLTFTANLFEQDYDYHDSEPYYYSQTEAIGNLRLKRFELCNIDNVCYYQVFVTFNQGKVRLSQLRDPDEPWASWKRWFQTRLPLEKVS